MIKIKKKLLDNKKKRPLTKNEIFLITTLIIMGTSFLSYNKLLYPKWTEYKEEKEKLESLQFRYDNLERDYRNLNKLKKDKQIKEYQLTELMKQVPSYITDEDILLTVGNYAKKRNIFLRSLELEENSLFRPENFVNEEDEEKLKDIKEEDPNRDFNKEEAIKELLPLVMTKYINLNFKCEVMNLHGFIDDLEKNQRKVVAKEINIKSNDEGKLEGNMKMQYISYKDKDISNKYEITVPYIEGKNTPFSTIKKAPKPNTPVINPNTNSNTTTNPSTTQNTVNNTNINNESKQENKIDNTKQEEKKVDNHNAKQ